MKLLLSAGRVIDPANKIDDFLDILIEDGKIVKVAKDIKDKTAKVENLKGKVIVPGLIDMHVHLREPGFEYKETIATGARSAVMGGFTSVACMPNTEPVMDNTAVVELVISKGKKENLANVFPIASVSKHAKGEEISDIGMLLNSGAVALSDDAAPLMNAEVMRRAFEYTKQFNVSIITHCEDKNMTIDGVMNESFNSTTLGLRGMASVAESLMVYRNIAIANYMGALVHIAHVSCKESVEIIRWAKKQGMKVTCETAPHYFTLTDEAVKTYDTNTKMNPPLRGAEDVKAIKAGLKDGTIDCIASDHAPHGRIDKELEYNYASFGIVGLETMVPLTLTELVDKKILTLEQAVEKLSVMPAKVLGLKKGTLSVGADADITVLDIEKKYNVDVNKFESKSKNSPFNGKSVKGAAFMTIVGGEIKMKEGKIL
ncbi:MAG: dihydroorotase [Candidatus Firestonebacteria bacterium RIFOXYA2_FULL_40_8]|nr:MAG: dihydroorotase [Candidatus Firestonebacteria bacterium RIFOXYA2_FULL_40_8]